MRTTISALLSIGLLGCATDKSTPSTLTVMGGSVLPTLLAVQDGDGPWTVLDANAGVYTTTVVGNRYGVMTICGSPMFVGPSIIYATPSDATTLFMDDCNAPDVTAANISGKVTGAAPADPVRVLVNDFGQIDVAAGATAYSTSTSPGPQKLFAEELVADRPVKLAVLDATVVEGAMLDFDLASGFAPEVHALTASGTIASASLWYRDEHGISGRIDRAAAPFDTFRAIPTDKLGGGLDRLTVSDGMSSVYRYFTVPVDQHITFPSPIQLAKPPTATATPYPNVSFTVPLKNTKGAIFDLAFSTTNPTVLRVRSWSAEMTSAWLGKAFSGASSFTYTFPDFRGLPGWQPDFQADAGLPLDWTVSQENVSHVDWYPSVPPDTLNYHDGSEAQLSAVDGQLAAP